MSKEVETHAAKHVRSKAKEINPNDVVVKFSPGLQSSLNKVLDAVRNSPVFDRHNSVEQLNSLASGQMNALMTIRVMKDITEDIAAHTKATKNPAAQSAWQEFSERIIDPPAGEMAFTFVQAQKGRQRS